MIRTDEVDAVYAVMKHFVEVDMACAMVMRHSVVCRLSGCCQLIRSEVVCLVSYLLAACCEYHWVRRGKGVK